jgi:hypothetical protein
MCRADLEARPSVMVEALRRHASAFEDRHRAEPWQRTVLGRLLACRTEAMGMHRCSCEACGWTGYAHDSCGDRHCPRCSGRATGEWLEARQARMLSVPHFQVVFTLPAELRSIAKRNPRVVYALLLQVGASVLLDLTAQRLEARPGLTAVLHTWTRDLTYHPHAHILVTAGGLHLREERWVPTPRPDFLFPGRVMGRMFRGRFLERLIDAHENRELLLREGGEEGFRRMVQSLACRHDRWVVHVEPPKGRPPEHVTRYLARYVKRVAIADARIHKVTDRSVVFQGATGRVCLDGAEFVRRFLLHVLPPAFRKVRHYGLYAPGSAGGRLEMARRLLSQVPGADAEPTREVESGEAETTTNVESQEAEPEQERRSSGWTCPACGQRTVHRIISTTSTRRATAPRRPP